MRRDDLIQHISSSPAPVSTAAAAGTIGLPSSAEVLAAVDILLTLSPEVNSRSDGWAVSADTRERRVLAALRDYASSHPERRIFRGSAALGHLPTGDQMTEEQLRALLSKSGEFRLLANGMVRRGS